MDSVWDGISIVLVAWTALTLVAAGAQKLGPREIDVADQARSLALSLVALAGYWLLMDLALTTQAVAIGAILGLALGVSAGLLAGYQEDYGVVVARGAGLPLLVAAVASLAAIAGAIWARDDFLALGMLALIAGCAAGSGQTAYWLAASFRARAGLAAFVVAPPSPDLLAAVTFPESMYSCANGHPVAEPSFAHCLLCGAPVAAVPMAPLDVPAAIQVEPPATPATAGTCAACGAIVQPNTRFCVTCGASLVQAAAAAPPAGRPCSSCGGPVLPGQRFCTVCGRRAA